MLKYRLNTSREEEYWGWKGSDLFDLNFSLSVYLAGIASG